MNDRAPALAHAIADQRDNCLRLLEGPARRGIDAGPLLDAAGIDRRLPDLPLPVTLAQFTRLLRATGDALDDEYFGFAAAPCRPGSHALILEMALHCDTLGAAAAQTARLCNHIAPGLEIACETRDDELLLSVRPRAPALDPRGFLVEFWLLLWQRNLSWLAACLLPTRRVELCSAEPPSPGRLIALVRDDWVAGAARNAVVLSGRLAGLPVVRTRAELDAHLRQGRAGTPVWPEADFSTRSEVRNFLAAHLARTGAWPALSDAAAEFGTTAQTLRRRLRDEGSTYGELRDRLRCALAIDKLQVPGLSVADVAAQLGYAEVRSFSRAFRQWTGSAPGAYRRRPGGG